MCLLWSFCCIFFFFFKQKTAYDMRISDWSSDVCSSDLPRWVIDAGRERRNFAIGDKVMATKNDWEAGITNGMTGIVTNIVEHGDYTGNRAAFGRQDLVDAYLEELDDESDEAHGLSLE